MMNPIRWYRRRKAMVRRWKELDAAWKIYFGSELWKRHTAEWKRRHVMPPIGREHFVHLPGMYSTPPPIGKEMQQDIDTMESYMQGSQNWACYGCKPLIPQGCEFDIPPVSEAVAMRAVAVALR